jgi:DNA polymerase-1
VAALIQENKLKSQLLLQVHDELIFEVAPGEEESLTKVVRKGMGSAFELKAPLDVSIGLGSSWNEAAH